MKKLISLLFCSAIICSAFAQRNGHNKRYDNYSVYQNNNYKNNQRARLIQRINNEYNFKINQVSYNGALKRGQKKHAIKMLEKQRAFEISRVNARYNTYGYNNRNKGYDRNDRRHDKDWND